VLDAVVRGSRNEATVRCQQTERKDCILKLRKKDIRADGKTVLGDASRKGSRSLDARAQTCEITNHNSIDLTQKGHECLGASPGIDNGFPLMGK
jgi:hypothetical protein